MRRVLVIDPFDSDAATAVELFGHRVELRRIGCRGELERARSLVAEHDGTVDAIALDGIPITLRLGSEVVRHEAGESLVRAALRTPVVDGAGVRSALERWSVYLAERAQPGLFAGKRTLMVPGVNHVGLAHALSLRTRRLRYADPVVFFGLRGLPGLGRASTVGKVAGATLRALRRVPIERFAPPPGARPRARRWFAWADVLAGDVGAIRALGPASLARKTIVVDAAQPADVEDLARRGASRLVTLMPSLTADETVARLSASVVEALLAATRPADLPLSEDTYLDMVSELDWQPAVRFLHRGESDVHRFAFVVHPLEVRQIHSNPLFRWTRHLPDALVEPLAARIPPMRIGRITGARSPVTGQRVEGRLIALGATPRQMLRRSPEFTYRRLRRAARLAEREGARVMGLGAFTSVVGDAGLSVARDAPIAVTSGNSLTVAATLEAAKLAAVRMGIEDLSSGRAMIVGATGSIGAVCARMIAQAIRDVVLVSIDPERLIEIKRRILAETPGARVCIATRADGLIAGCDLIVTATSAFGQRILDISQCKPGAIICDVARPPDINEAEAALRPDVLVIESGEVLIPGDVEFQYDIGLPPRVAYACLAETALLAMEGRFESFTVGRELSIERVKEIHALFHKHRFELAGLRSLGRYLTESDLAEKRCLAEQLRADEELLRNTRAAAARRLAEIPIRAKGVRADRPPATGFDGVRLAGLTPWLRRGHTPSGGS